MAVFRAEFNCVSGNEEDAAAAIRNNRYRHYKVGDLCWLLLIQDRLGLDPKDVEGDLNEHVSKEQGSFQVSAPTAHDQELVESHEILFDS